MIKRPMKGYAVDDLHRIRFPILGSVKIDGFRCVLAEQAYTSRLKHFPNRYVHNQLKGMLPKGVILDGELVVGKRHGPGVLQRTSSGVTSQDGEPDWRLWVFDRIDDPMLPFSRRLRLAELIVKQLDHPQIRFVDHDCIEDRDYLEFYLAASLDKGFEGIYLRSIDGPYKEGRSTLREQYAMKIKPFEDAEARISGWYEQMENTNEAVKDATGKTKRSSAKAGKFGKGTLGGLIGHDVKTGVDVRCGSGISDALRLELWSHRHQLPGQVFTYKRQKVGAKDKARHPIFVQIRPIWDYSGNES